MEDRKKIVELIDNLKSKDNHPLNSYIQEAIDCFNNNCNKATIILVWSIWMFFLYEKIKDYGLRQFYEFCKSKNVSIEGRINQIYDLQKIKDADIIRLCRDIGFYDTNIKNQLENYLNLRNSCAHVSQLDITQYQLFSYIEQLCSYISIVKALNYNHLNQSTIERLRKMNDDEINQLAKNLGFESLISTIDGCFDEITFISTGSEYQRNQNLYKFISVSVQCRDSDEERVQIFKIIFEKITKESIFFVSEITNNFQSMFQTLSIRKYMLNGDNLDKLISIFVNSGSFANAKENARALVVFKKDFSSEQIKAITNAFLTNRQVTDSGGAISALKIIFAENKEKFTEDLIIELKAKGLEI